MEYAYDNALPQQLRRLRTLEELFDTGSIRVLEARGLQPSWRCLEVGAGGGSIARWLAERTAFVLATDLDTTHVREVAGSNLEVREHDLLRDELPDEAFDLIHLRLVLAWLGDRPAALARLQAALRPGGWLVTEELDFNAGGRIWRMTIEQLRAPIVERGLAAPEEVGEALALFDDERFSSVSPLLIAAWARSGAA